ncbi:RDD family protein [Oceanibium sediminis]|uniref:RDD family protein n=1 Tax=Oceanibium sediminis TaxID=2026339 RepID=UPI000DD4164E|nr:RDD family protein [Oceanibium sediminis]
MSFYADMDPFNDLPHPEHDKQFYEGVPSKRLAAWVFDLILITILSGVFTLAFGIITFGFGFMAFPAILFLFSFLYRWLTIASSSATWGMRLMGIELRTRKGHRLDGMTAAIHSGMFVALMASVVGALATAGCILTTRYNQGLPDLILGTTAINRPVD